MELKRTGTVVIVNGVIAFLVGVLMLGWPHATAEVVAEAGYAMDDVPPHGERIPVRRTANLHTGGTIEDVTDRLHPEIAEAAVRAAEALGIPVTGIDFLVPAVDGPDYVFIEANERPGLANHEPQPVAERFVDLLFPETRRR